MAIALPPRLSFSTKLPTLQLAIDSTSLGAYKDCPRRYAYSILLGMVPRAESAHLTFGLLYHGALERYDHARASGQSNDEATLLAVRYCLEQTWHNGRPWASDIPEKNRLTLVRTVVWYLEEFSRENDVLETVILDNGKPAVELSFQFHLPYESQTTGEPFVLCGHLDRLARHRDMPNQVWIADRKTTKSTLGQGFFDKFSPDNQFSGYTLGGTLTYRLPVAGLIVDAAQVAVTFSRFQRGIIQRTEETLEEWLQDLGTWLADMEQSAVSGRWRMNDRACSHYGGCPYRPICSKPPSVRDQWLEAGYVQRVWDPLKARGDI